MLDTIPELRVPEGFSASIGSSPRIVVGCAPAVSVKARRCPAGVPNLETQDQNPEKDLNPSESINPTATCGASLRKDAFACSAIGSGRYFATTTATGNDLPGNWFDR